MLFSNEQNNENISFKDFNYINIVDWLQVSLLSKIFFSVIQ